jgi:hypothetical protein
MPQKTKCPQCNFVLPKNSRKPNRYNEFISEAMKNPNIKSLPAKKRMQACALVWKKQKNAQRQKKLKRTKSTRKKNASDIEEDELISESTGGDVSESSSDKGEK